MIDQKKLKMYLIPDRKKNALMIEDGIFPLRKGI